MRVLNLSIKPTIKFALPEPTILVALVAVYSIWGSTYLVTRVAVQTFPPFLLTGVRYILPGVPLFLFLRARGAPMPTFVEWRNAAAVGALMLGLGTGAVAFSEQWVASGLASLAVAAVPLWASLWAGLWGRWPTRREGMGLVLGMTGIVLLNREGNLQANPIGAIALIMGPLCWSFASIWSRRLALPKGMISIAIEMISGGIALLVIGTLLGERFPPAISRQIVGAVAYLAIFGALVAFSAYMYLLKHVRPALATSYAYINPVIAVLLGGLLAKEPITGIGIVAMLVILTGVVLVMMGREQKAADPRPNLEGA